MYESEQEFLKVVDHLDSLVDSFVRGELTYEGFLRVYGYPMGEYALDGHESSEVGRAILLRHRNRLELHEKIAEKIFHSRVEPNMSPAACEQLKDHQASTVRELASKFRATKT